MNSFYDTFVQYPWQAAKAEIYAKTAHDVARALARRHLGLGDFMALVSPAAKPYLEHMAQRSRKATLERFGKTMQLFTPLYLSNECHNICTYCGFSIDNPMRRKTLNADELAQEAEALKKMGFGHVLLVAGEANRTVGVPYFQRALRTLAPYFAHLAMEVQPLDEQDYQLLAHDGLNTVLVYQETYNQDTYKPLHPKGKKANFRYRLETPDRIGGADIHKIGLGALLGLDDWRTDSFFVALHLQYLEKQYWKTKYSISFPRLRPFSGGSIVPCPVSDSDLVQLICAFRIFNQEVELAMSTREHETFRDHAAKLGITTMSAGSKTNPGGYTVAPASLEQFEISDERPPHRIADMLRQQGYEAVWKDWDRAYTAL